VKHIIAQYVRGLLESGRIQGFLGLIQEGENIRPYLFTRAGELDGLNLGDNRRPGDTRYPLIKELIRLVRTRPNDVFGLLVRGCDERALRRILSYSRSSVLNPARVALVGFSCPEELALRCQCQKPWPDERVAGDKTPGADPIPPSAYPFAELEAWFVHSDRCLKCFGCRNVCPVCDCRECSMEIEALVPQRELPATKSFLMTRAVHMVDRCVYCGLCEEACPAGIPLKSLYRLVARTMGREAGDPRDVIPSDFFGLAVRQ
jgi:ferredoxin